MKQNKSKGGYAIVTVMGIIAVLSIMLAMVVHMTRQRVFDTQRTVQQAKLLAYAEGNIDVARAILTQNYEAKDTPQAFAVLSNATVNGNIITTPVEGGSISLVVESKEEGRYTLITATGSCHSIQVDAQALVEDMNFGEQTTNPESEEPESPEPPESPNLEGLNYAILCGGDFDFSGCGTISASGGEALFHSNGDMFVRGNTHPNISLSSSTHIKLNKISVGGDVTAPTIETHRQTQISGTKTEGAVPTVKIPQLDLSAYKAWAELNGEYYDVGSKTITSDYTPKGGIMWVRGDAHVTSHAVITGSIFTGGEIHFGGQADITPVAPFAIALASESSDLHVTTGGTIQGMLYAKAGGLHHTANGEIQGQIIVNGSIAKAGNSDILSTFTQNIPTPPVIDDPTTGDEIPGNATQKYDPQLAVWQK